MLARASILFNNRNEHVRDNPRRLCKVGIYALKRAEDVLVELFTRCSALYRIQAGDLFPSEHARFVWVIEPRHALCFEGSRGSIVTTSLAEL